MTSESSAKIRLIRGISVPFFSEDRERIERGLGRIATIKDGPRYPKIHDQRVIREDPFDPRHQRSIILEKPGTHRTRIGSDRQDKSRIKVP